MKRKMTALILMIMFLSFASCSSINTLSQQWKERTPEERARITIALAQHIVESAFKLGVEYVKVNPKFEPEWKETVLPAIDKANKTIRDFTIAIQKYGVTQEDIISNVSPYIKVIAESFERWGLDYKSIKF